MNTGSLTSSRIDTRDGGAPGGREPDPPSAARSRRPSADVSPTERRSKRTGNLVRRYAALVAFLGVFALYAAWLGDRFIDVNNRLLDVHLNTPVILLALGVVVCLVAGQFDLSVGGMATLTTYLAVGLVVEQEWPLYAALLACLAVGLVGGALNGLLVQYMRVNAFIATLGTGSIFVGLSRVYSGGGQLTTTVDGPQLPTWFSGGSSLGSFLGKVPTVGMTLVFALIATYLLGRAVSVVRGRLDGASAIAAIAALTLLAISALWIVVDALAAHVPWSFALLLCVASILWITLTYTAYGRELYAAGGNPEAARLAGVNVPRKVVSVFVLSGLLSALSGVMLAASQGSASPDAAVPFLLPAFAGAFLSTVLLSTGRFHIWGTVLGSILTVWVAQGLIVGGVQFTWTEVISGAVLVAAVGLSAQLQRAK